MVPAVNPVIAEVNAQVAEAAPSSVWLPVATGLDDVLQQTPWAVGLGAPSAVTFPLPVAVVLAMPVTA